LILMVVLSIGSAALVGVVSRSPTSLREAKPGVEAHDPALGSSFTGDQVRRHAAFRGPGYLAFVLSTLLPIVLLVLMTRGPFASLVERMDGIRGGWVIRSLVVAAIVTGLTTIFLLPLGFVRGYINAKAWGLSTQQPLDWALDQVKSLGVGVVIAGLAAVAFYGVVRAAPRTWWLWGWLAFTVLTAILIFLYPVAIAPLFNRFESLEAGPLRDRIIELGEAAGVPLDDVLVSDASRRTTAENAYVAGLGATKQMVIYDTLLENSEDEEALFIVAHELGHRRENHVLKNVALSSLGLLLGFALLYRLGPTLMTWAGASGIGDVRGLPALLLFLSVASLVLLPVQNAASRAFERTADEAAIELTGDPEPGVRAFRRLAFNNIADLRPNPVAVWLLYTHPPIPERIESFLDSR
jgi:STE24 endopeptidase